MHLYRYSRWDGTQQVFSPDQEQIMDELSKELLSHGDVRKALRDLFQRGMQNQSGERISGLRDLMDRLRQHRQEQLQRYNLDSLMDDLHQRLKKVINTERAGIQHRVDEAKSDLEQKGKDPSQDQLMKLLQERAQKNLETLDNLPKGMSGAIKELSNYEFMDPQAQQQFQELLDMLKQRMLQNFLQNMRQSLKQMSTEQMAALRQMLSDLNKMLQDRMEGREPDFQGFMDKHGSLFGPEPPKSLEELLQRLQHQIAKAQSLLDSMSPEMRRELEDLLSSVLDPETRAELEELANNLGELMPSDELRRQYPFMGDEPVTLEQAMQLMGQLQSMDELEQKLQQIAKTGNLEELDPQKLEELLGPEARRSFEELQRLAKLLEESGYVKRNGNRLELTPKGMRKIAQNALKEVFINLKKDRLGHHSIHTRGEGGEPSGETKPFQFGDPLDINLVRTLMNALTREGANKPVKLILEDFEINHNEHISQASTVLLLDQSRSMGLFGSFQAAKKVALALYALIQSRFPRDTFHIIGFSDYAIEIKRQDLPGVSWNAWVSGTNMHHAFMLSRKLLSKHKNGTRQIIMVTDGEPTAHLEGNISRFSYPPSMRTIQETLKEVRRCTQEHITINTFMLETTDYLLDFVDKMTRINKGRAFFTTPDKLGEYLLVDYISNRKKRVS